jgi:hypothetical protein
MRTYPRESRISKRRHPKVGSDTAAERVLDPGYVLDRLGAFGVDVRSS